MPIYWLACTLRWNLTNEAVGCLFGEYKSHALNGGKIPALDETYKIRLLFSKNRNSWCLVYFVSFTFLLNCFWIIAFLFSLPPSSLLKLMATSFNLSMHFLSHSSSFTTSSLVFKMPILLTHQAKAPLTYVVSLHTLDLQDFSHNRDAIYVQICHRYQNVITGKKIFLKKACYHQTIELQNILILLDFYHHIQNFCESHENLNYFTNMAIKILSHKRVPHWEVPQQLNLVLPNISTDRCNILSQLWCIN